MKWKKPNTSYTELGYYIPNITSFDVSTHRMEWWLLATILTCFCSLRKVRMDFGPKLHFMLNLLNVTLYSDLGMKLPSCLCNQVICCQVSVPQFADLPSTFFTPIIYTI